MNWNPQMEVHYNNISCPYNTAGGFMEYFEGLTYEHVNFIFNGASHPQECLYPSMTSFYKSELSDLESSSYFHDSNGYEVNRHEPQIDGYRRPSENLSTITELPTPANTEWAGGPHRHNNSHDYQVILQDNIDPDHMAYEELLELGEAVGTQSRGLSQEQISLLLVSKYKCGFFLRKKSRDERCVICQMEYKGGDKQITLPCKHVYHASCGKRWLSINKACPICYIEVFTNVANTNITN